MTFAILGILVLQKWGIHFAALSYLIMQKTLILIIRHQSPCFLVFILF